MVAGSEIFGGRGFSFVHPATLALAFLFFSFPVADGATEAPLVAAAAVPGIAVLAACGMIAWRTLAGALAGLVLGLATFGLPWPATPALVLGIGFLLCDPASGAATNAGRLAHGFLAGL